MNEFVGEVDVGPALAGDLSASHASQGHVPGVPVAIGGNAVEDDLYLLGGEGFKPFCFARDTIDEKGDVAGEIPFGDQLCENLPEGSDHVVAGSWAPRFASAPVGAP